MSNNASLEVKKRVTKRGRPWQKVKEDFTVFFSDLVKRFGGVGG